MFLVLFSSWIHRAGWRFPARRTANQIARKQGRMSSHIIIRDTRITDMLYGLRLQCLFVRPKNLGCYGLKMQWKDSLKISCKVESNINRHVVYKERNTEYTVKFIFDETEKGICLVIKLNERSSLSGQKVAMICGWVDFQVCHLRLTQVTPKFCV